MKSLVFCVLLLCYYGVDGDSVDFDQVVKDYIKEKESKGDLEFWDIYRDNAYFNKNPKEKKHKLKVHVLDDVEYEKPIVKAVKILQTVKQTFQNKDLKKSKTEVFSKTFKSREQFTWKVLHGLKMKYPPYIEENDMVGFLSNMLFTESKNNTISQVQQKTLKKDAKVKVPPNSLVTAKWNIVERTVEIPWKIKITMKGDIILKRKNSKKTEKISIGNLAGRAGFQKRESRSSALKMRASGVLTTVSILSANLILETKPLGKGKERQASLGEVYEEQETDDDVAENEKETATPVIKTLIDVIGEDLEPDSKLGPWLVIAGTLAEYFAGTEQSPEQWKAFAKAVKTAAVNIFKSKTTQKLWKGLKNRFKRVKKGVDTVDDKKS